MRRLTRRTTMLALSAVVSASLAGGVMLGAQLGRVDTGGWTGIPALVLFFVLQLWQANALRRLGSELGEEREPEDAP